MRPHLINQPVVAALRLDSVPHLADFVQLLMPLYSHSTASDCFPAVVFLLLPALLFPLIVPSYFPVLPHYYLIQLHSEQVLIPHSVAVNGWHPAPSGHQPVLFLHQRSCGPRLPASLSPPQVLLLHRQALLLPPLFHQPVPVPHHSTSLLHLPGFLHSDVLPPLSPDLPIPLPYHPYKHHIHHCISHNPDQTSPESLYNSLYQSSPMEDT